MNNAAARAPTGWRRGRAKTLGTNSTAGFITSVLVIIIKSRASYRFVYSQTLIKNLFDSIYSQTVLQNVGVKTHVVSRCVRGTACLSQCAQDASKKLSIGIGNPLRARTAAAAVAAGAAAAAAAQAADDGDKGCPSPIDVAKLPRLGTAGSSRMLNVLGPGSRVGSRALVATQVETDPNIVPWKTGNMYPIVENKLSFASHVSDDFTLREIKRRPDLFFFSSDLQERWGKWRIEM